MNRKWIITLSLAILLTAILVAAPALAGPGGFIAKAVTKTLWGKILMGIVVLFFLPLIIWIIIREKLAERRSRKDLRFMTRYDSNFEWLKAKERIVECFQRIHGAWREEDVSEASEFMTDWYWQNQQMVFLDRWKREGLTNICDVKKIRNIRPILFVHLNDGMEHEGSILIVSITAYMKDFLVRKATDEVVEGDKKYKDHETIWSFTLINDKWRVSNIEESDMSLEYATQIKHLPKIEETVLGF